VFVAAIAAQPLGAQASTNGAVPGVTINPWVSQALREQLSAGYGQRREPSGVLKALTPDRPLLRQVPVLPETTAAVAPRPGVSRCPMPVVKVDPRSLATMPVARPDTQRIEKMPVARSSCVNPLDVK